MCQLLWISESGYYRWRHYKAREDKYSVLLSKILKIRAKNPDYGSRRVFLELKLKHQYTGCYGTIRAIYRKNNLTLRLKHKQPNGITKSDKNAEVNENLIKQNFSASSPNTKWLSDITEIKLSKEKLYLCAILDCFDGAIVGFHIDTNMKRELCITSFQKAIEGYGGDKIIFHSDRGSQYTSNDFRKELAMKAVIQSMSKAGNCYDNARMESFFATLKKELIYKYKPQNLSVEAAKSLVFRYIEFYYNRERIYSTNGGYPPLVKRELFYANTLHKAA